MPDPKPTRDEVLDGDLETLDDVKKLVEARCYEANPTLFWSDCATVTWGEEHPFSKEFLPMVRDHIADVTGCTNFAEQMEPGFQLAVLSLLGKIFDALTRGLKAHGLSYDLD